MKNFKDILADWFSNSKYIELHSGDVDKICELAEEYANNGLNNEDLKRISGWLDYANQNFGFEPNDLILLNKLKSLIKND